VNRHWFVEGHYSFGGGCASNVVGLSEKLPWCGVMSVSQDSGIRMEADARIIWNTFGKGEDPEFGAREEFVDDHIVISYILPRV
jgi:hypothetical protein